jgi:phage terminase Nu1 subunit (DNA packaging protein)
MGPQAERSGRLSARAFARRVGVDEAQVRKAIRTGRLERCLGRWQGRVVIADVALADREWRENQDPAKAPTPGRGRRSTVADARRRVLDLQAAKLQQDYDLRAGTLVAIDEVETRLTPMILQARNQLLGLPAHAKQRLPHLTPADLAVLDQLVREALEELAAGDHPQPKAGVVEYLLAPLNRVPPHKRNVP